MKAGTDSGAMPANVSVNARATVTAGLAKLVDDVNQYAAAMYAPTTNGTIAARPLRTAPKITTRSPTVATVSPSQMPEPERTWSDHSTAGRSNITFATIVPSTAPTTCAPMYVTVSRVVVSPPNARSASVTTGLRWAPDTEP